MPRLLLEGKSITALLAQVREEHGPDVTIVAADKVRTRGIGGFFARESYALTVEVDGDPVAASDARIHDLMDARGLTTRRGDAFMDAAAGMDAQSRGVQAPGSLLDLAAAIDAAEATENSVILATRPMHMPTPQPAISTTSAEFASILARLNELDTPQPEAAPEPATAAPVDPYTRLREVLAEIAPHIDFTTSVPIVLVIPPAVAVETPTAAPVQAAAPPIPEQGRHRRAHAAT